MLTGIVLGVNKVLKVDPFASFRPNASGSAFDMKLGKFDMKSYQDGKMVASADVESGSLAKGTRTIEMAGVENGNLIGPDGEKVELSAQAATYDLNSKDLIAPLGVNIKTGDTSIQSQGMSYTHQTQEIKAPGALKGKIGDGVVTGTGLTIKVPEKKTLLETVTYQGQTEVDSRRSNWKFQAEDWESTGKDTVQMQKGRAESEDTIIYADQMNWDKKEDVLVCSGNVRYYGEEVNMVCDKVTVRRKESRAIFEGKVTMLIKPESQTSVAESPVERMTSVRPEDAKPERVLAPKGSPERPNDDQVREQKTLREYPISILADRIDYIYKKGQRKGEITGAPQARQELAGGRWRRVWADSATYDGESDRLLMKSNGSSKNARLRNSLGDDLRAISVEVSTKKDDDMMKAKSSEGTMMVDDEEVPGKDGG